MRPSGSIPARSCRSHDPMGAIHRLMPELHAAPPRARAAARAAGVTMLAMLAIHVVHTTLGVGTRGVADAAQTLGTAALLVVLGTRAATAPSDRGGWTALTLAAIAWIAGTLWVAVVGAPPAGAAVSMTDVFYGLFYPFAYLAVGLRARAQAGRPARRVWLDGLIAMLSVGAVGWLLTVGPILAQPSDDHLAAFVDSAYVVGDLLLAALTVAVLGLNGWRAGRSLGVLAGGLAVFAAADSLYMLRAAAGTYAPGT